MWPFKRRGPDRDTIQRLEDVEREMRRLKEDWIDYLDKISRRDERLRKRQERASGQIPAFHTPQDVKAALRARWAATRGSNGTP